MMSLRNTLPVFVIVAGYSVLGLLAIFFFDGTGDNGDSVLHYLMARYAPDHPKLFFNHWGKPIFTLLASPFAQFGFPGIKVFNLIVTVLSALLTYKVAISLKLKNAPMAALIMLASPLGMVLALSGLTEPLFGLFMILGILLFVQNRVSSAAIVISFLPFVRSEGLLIVCVFGLLILIRKDWKSLALLSTGHILVGLAGMWVYDSPWWVITRIPYATVDSVYGSGSLLHMASKMVFILGIPVLILFLLGFIKASLQNWRFWIFKNQNMALIIGCFSAVFVFHSLAWYLGMFNSMGLKRVMVGVIPCTAILGLAGFNLLSDVAAKVNSKLEVGVQSLLVTVLIGFPITSNHAALHLKELRLGPEQTLATQMLATTFSDGVPEATFYYSPVYLSQILTLDHFDLNQHRKPTKTQIEKRVDGDIIIWDSDTGAHPNTVALETLSEMENLKRVFDESISKGAGTYRMVVFVCEE